MWWAIIGVFEDEVYSALNVSGRVVVDVGAHVGDSPTYFALMGARRVIAIEPHPDAYMEMLENIKLNNVENVITPVNAGLSSKPGRICVEDVDVGRTYATYHRPGECSRTVPAITLADVIHDYGVDYDSVLKMDCEDCEYDVILNDYDHVKLFSEIIVEFHKLVSGEPVSKLLKVLARDYDCNLIENTMSITMVHCTRKHM